MKKEKRFYETAIFLWILLYFYAPLGILFLYGYKFYNPLTRFVIGTLSLLFFISNFSLSISSRLFSFIILIIIFLKWVMNKASVKEEKREFIEYSDLEKLTDEEYLSFISFFLNKLGYSCRRNIDNPNHGVYLFGNKDDIKIGVSIRRAEIIDSDLSLFYDGLSHYDLNLGFLFTKDFRNDLKAERGILFWDKKKLTDKLAELKIKFEELGKTLDKAI